MRKVTTLSKIIEVNNIDYVGCIDTNYLRIEKIRQSNEKITASNVCYFSFNDFKNEIELEFINRLWQCLSALNVSEYPNLSLVELMAIKKEIAKDICYFTNNNYIGDVHTYYNEDKTFMYKITVLESFYYDIVYDKDDECYSVVDPNNEEIIEYCQ